MNAFSSTDSISRRRSSRSTERVLVTTLPTSRCRAKTSETIVRVTTTFANSYNDPTTYVSRSSAVVGVTCKLRDIANFLTISIYIFGERAEIFVSFGFLLNFQVSSILPSTISKTVLIFFLLGKSTVRPFESGSTRRDWKHPLARIIRFASSLHSPTITPTIRASGQIFSHHPYFSLSAFPYSRASTSTLIIFLYFECKLFILAPSVSSLSPVPSLSLPLFAHPSVLSTAILGRIATILIRAQRVERFDY